MPHIVGAFEHPTRKAEDKSIAQLHAESAKGALDDAGLAASDVDGYFVSGDAPGVLGALSMSDYLGLSKLRHIDTTDIGGASPIAHVAHAAQAISAGRCRVALISMGGKLRTLDPARIQPNGYGAPEAPFETPFGISTHALYAMAANRHMYEFGTTGDQLAWVKVAASHHAYHNPNAMLRERVTIEDVAASPMIADPLHKLDCCVVSDGGGAIVVAAAEIARSLTRPAVSIRGAGEAIAHQRGGKLDITRTAGALSGPQAFAQARLTPADIKYASIYDSFTITVIITLEDLGFCAKGEGGRFVSDGRLISGVGTLPVNTDGGSLCNNHPAGRGGLPKVVEAVRQLRGEAYPAVQVPNCDLALVHGSGGYIASRGGSATLILQRG
jgi:acetyl-CoA C-acetyltransferase